LRGPGHTSCADDREDPVNGLSQAIRVLIGCPFVNGLRART